MHQVDSADGQLARILNTMEDALMAMSIPDRRLLYASASFERVYGYPSTDFINDSTLFQRVIHPDDLEKAVAAMMQCVREGYAEIDFRIIHPDGQVAWLHRRAWIVCDATGKPIQIIDTATDITRYKEAEAALQAANELLEERVRERTSQIEATLNETVQRERELSSLKTHFVFRASHEFRTPLAAILATTETLTHYRDRMTREQIDERLDRIREQVAHMKGIMEDVLTLAELQSEKLIFMPSLNDVDALCQAIIEQFDNQPAYHGRIQYHGQQPPMPAVCDRRHMHEVVSNLIHNALKYSEASTHVQVFLTHPPGQLRLEVQDHGIGIPPHDLSRIFEPFHRAGNVGSISGSGLGLSIIKQAVDLHGGTIDIVTEVDRGTTFIVTIPQPPSEQACDENADH